MADVQFRIRPHPTNESPCSLEVSGCRRHVSWEGEQVTHVGGEAERVVATRRPTNSHVVGRAPVAAPHDQRAAQEVAQLLEDVDQLVHNEDAATPATATELGATETGRQLALVRDKLQGHRFTACGRWVRVSCWRSLSWRPQQAA